MDISNVYGVFFSATGTTEKIVRGIADGLVSVLAPGKKAYYYDFTLPAGREAELVFGEGDVVVFGTPTYAGRVPNVLLPFIRDKVRGSKAVSIPVVTFGNRNYDDSLIELVSLLDDDGFISVGAGAFIGEHSFSYKLAKGRPDEQDMMTVHDLAERAAKRIECLDAIPERSVKVKGNQPVRPYYTPRDRNGNGIDIRKVKPVTGHECTRCGICADVCPMGSISRDDPAIINGICIKCGACVKKCPESCRFFDDENYLYHMHELEDMYTRRAEPEIFI